MNNLYWIGSSIATIVVYCVILEIIVNINFSIPVLIVVIAGIVFLFFVSVGFIMQNYKKFEADVFK